MIARISDIPQNTTSYEVWVSIWQQTRLNDIQLIKTEHKAE